MSQPEAVLEPPVVKPASALPEDPPVPSYPLEGKMQTDLVGWIPFMLMHVAAAVGPFLVPFYWWLPVLFLVMYYVRVIGLTGGYHRYFAHRAFRTSRPFQFFLALLGTLAAQKGPIWWAGHHRHHHKFSDEPEDIHSPVQRGFWYSHVLWIFDKRNDGTRWDLMGDYKRFPELRFLDKYALLPPLVLAIAIYLVFEWTLGAGISAVSWGFFLSTVCLYHGTFTVNSLNHVWGTRRYESEDDSRNNPVLAMITAGEGWHNNHHHYQVSAMNGFAWYEIDLTWRFIRTCEMLGLVWKVQRPTKRVLVEGGLLAASALEGAPVESNAPPAEPVEAAA